MRSPANPLTNKCHQLLVELDLAQPNDVIDVVPLTGGVASDIAMVATGDRKLCVKFALPKLKVQAEWFAPVHRNIAEYAWLKVAGNVRSEGAITLLGQSRQLQGFAMEYLDGEDTYLWKESLLAELPDNGEAAKVGHLLGQIHGASAETGFDTSAFQNRDDFHALRIEPYLLFTASQHEDIAPQLKHMATTLYESNQVLIHGDVSPKNIFFRSNAPIILDAECATMGDASFDVSFCLNHLVLKAFHLPASREQYLANALSLWKAYCPSISWETSFTVESRICSLLPMLMLARVDGKSPIEYLAESERASVRRIARHFIKSPAIRLDELLHGIKHFSQEIVA